MKNVIKNTIYKIGKIYIGNDISELNTYLKNIENDLLKLNKNWKIDDFSNKVVEELEKNRVLEIAIYNLKKSNNNIICKKILESAENLLRRNSNTNVNWQVDILDDTSKKVDIMLIKGMAISQYYPANYHRNQSDIDILVKNFKDLSFVLNSLENKYTYKKMKLHFLFNDKLTATIDLIPKQSNMPFIDIHLTPYYMWGAVSYFENVWEYACKKNNFFVPKTEDIILMLCSHLSNQWMYRMRDINDLYCILRKNNFKIEWDTLFFRSKELGIYSLMRILFTQLIDVYGIVFEEKVRNQFNLDKDLYFRELLFRKYNLGNESAKGSILLEMNFLFENYKKIFKLRTLVFHILKNTFFMIITHNRAFYTGKFLKKIKDNEVLVLKKINEVPSITSMQALSNDIYICNKGTKHEVFKINLDFWKQISYHEE